MSVRYRTKQTIYQVIFTLVLLSLPIRAAVGAASPLWGELEPGPYAVGFENVEKYDYSRVYRDKYDYDGNIRSEEVARPIQIYIWYPASAEAETPSMVYGEYAFAAPEDNRFYPLLAGLQGREAGYAIPFLAQSRGLLQDLMNMNVTAFKDAPREQGEFPLIIYHPDAIGGISQNAVLCEYLASYGFIVATSHALGAQTLNAGMDAVGLETMIRDREFVYGHMRDYPQVDNNKPGLLGVGTGGLSALLMQMRNTDIEAVAALDGIFTYNYGIRLGTEFANYSVARADAPILQMYIADHDSLDLSLVDSLRFSRRLLFAVSERDRNDFTLYPFAGALLADTSAERVRSIEAFYGRLCETVREFFEVFLKGDDLESKAFVSSAPDTFWPVTYSLKEGEIPPPTERQFVEMIQEDKIERAIEIYEQLKKTRPGYVFFQEATMNGLGYQLLQQNRLGEARMIFRMNTEAFPNSANVWDSYADACLASGDTETAITCYQKVLEVLPSDSAVGPQVREILQNNATQGLEQLQQ
ncbi:MAG: hypothetical protein JSU74_07070 [Candidatus Zixiibacteriota bacterium]|nr:MAG: hypothetical protein JSU74_07070 [candidate division Zixibacteria bacterium]